MSSLNEYAKLAKKEYMCFYFIFICILAISLIMMICISAYQTRQGHIRCAKMICPIGQPELGDRTDQCVCKYLIGN